jgi:hypothetical protein
VDYYYLLMTLVFAQSKADDSPEGDGADRNVGRAGKDPQAEACIMKTIVGEAAAAASGTGGDTQAEASTMKAVVEKATAASAVKTCLAAEIPHQLEV